MWSCCHFSLCILVSLFYQLVFAVLCTKRYDGYINWVTVYLSVTAVMLYCLCCFNEQKFSSWMAHLITDMSVCLSELRMSVTLLNTDRQNALQSKFTYMHPTKIQLGEWGIPVTGHRRYHDMWSMSFVSRNFKQILLYIINGILCNNTITCFYFHRNCAVWLCILNTIIVTTTLV